METLIAHPANKEQLNAIKIFQNKYNPKFVAKIKRSQKEIKEGKRLKINIDDFWQSNSN